MSIMIISDEVKSEHRCYNTKDIKRNYSLINLWNEMMKVFNILPNKEKDVDDELKSLKKGIRIFWKEKELNVKRWVLNGDIDGYLEKIEIPKNISSKELAEVWFEANEYKECRPSMYDCTGQSFTNWYKIVKLHDMLYAYHSVGFDV